MAVGPDTPITQLAGVGEARAKKLAKLGLAQDVYKRQPHSLPPFMVRARASWSSTEPRPLLMRIASVSYTHRDVYKRQPLGGAELLGLYGLEGRYGEKDLDRLILGGVTPVEQVGGTVSVVRGVTTVSYTHLSAPSEPKAATALS